MKVDVLPIGPPDSDSVPFAHDLAGALREHASIEADVRCDVGAGRGRGADVVHLVVARPDTREIADVAARSRTTVLATVVGVDLPESETLPPDVMRWYALTEALASALAAASGTPDRVRSMPAPVPDQSPATPVPAPRPGGTVALVLAPEAADAVVSQAIAALVDLGPRYRLEIVHAPTAGTDCWRREAVTEGVEERVQFAPAADPAQVMARLARAEVALVSSHHLAGTWNALTPLALGVPMLATPNPFTHDLMLRTHCVRLVRPHEPGHVAACLRAMLANDIGMVEMSERARSYARLASWEATAREYRSAYEEVSATARQQSREPLLQRASF